MDHRNGGAPRLGELLFPLYGFAVFQIAGTTARLGIVDALATGPASAAALAAATGAHPGALRRLLRAAVSLGLLTTVGDERFALTPLGAFFRRDSPWPAAPLDRMHAAAPVWQAWGWLDEAVRTGRPAFELAHGRGLFEQLADDPELAGRFHAAMTAGATVQARSIVRHYDFGRFRSIVDVGCGDGLGLAIVLAATPHLRGTAFDTVHALRDTPALLRRMGIADRCAVVAGDFFTTVPAGHDGYLLKNVLHNWDDAAACRILRRCRDAMATGGRVVVFTGLLDDGPDRHPDEDTLMALYDIEMLVLAQGRERTLDDYMTLFSAAGLRLAEVVRLPPPFALAALEATAAET